MNGNFNKMTTLLREIEAKCKDLGYSISTKNGYDNDHLFITHIPFKNVVDIGLTRAPYYVFVDNNNTSSIHHMPYTRHKSLSAIMCAIQNKPKEQ